METKQSERSLVEWVQNGAYLGVIVCAVGLAVYALAGHWQYLQLYPDPDAGISLVNNIALGIVAGIVGMVPGYIGGAILGGAVFLLLLAAKFLAQQIVRRAGLVAVRLGIR